MPLGADCLETARRFDGPRRRVGLVDHHTRIAHKRYLRSDTISPPGLFGVVLSLTFFLAVHGLTCTLLHEQRMNTLPSRLAPTSAANSFSRVVFSNESRG